MCAKRVQMKKPTSICRLVLATSKGHVAAAARLPATKPAKKFAPSTSATLGSSPIRPNNLLLICIEAKTKIISC